MNEKSPVFSVVIPARDEQKNLPGCLDAIDSALAFAGVAAEIIVVLNRCTDRTETIAADRGCRVTANDARNLSIIRNAGVNVARGEFVATIDADSRVSQNYFAEILSVMRSGRYIGGGVLIKPERYSLGIIATGFALAPVALIYGISAGSFYCRREDFLAIGGFDENRLSAEDIDFARRLKAFGRTQGKKFKNLLKAHIVTSCRKFDRFGDWYMLRNPWMWIRLWSGKDQESANLVWYDTPRE